MLLQNASTGRLTSLTVRVWHVRMPRPIAPFRWGEICQWVGFGIVNLREPLDHLRCHRAIEFASVANILELGKLTNMVFNLEAFVNRRSVSVRINDPVAVY
jgi:hypothetical protein